MIKAPQTAFGNGLDSISEHTTVGDYLWDLNFCRARWHRKADQRCEAVSDSERPLRKVQRNSGQVALGDSASGRFSSPRREYRHARNHCYNIEHSRRLRGTGLRPEDSPGGHFVSDVLGTARRKLSASVPNGVRMSGQWNGKVSERYAHLRIWGSQVMRVTVDRTQATVPVRHC